MIELCEDLALHDWLLTTLLSIAEAAMSMATESVQRARRLQPAVEYLLPLWMPAARLDDAVLPVWHALERRPGFTRQWDLSVNRVRDQITLSAILLIQEASRLAAPEVCTRCGQDGDQRGQDGEQRGQDGKV